MKTERELLARCQAIEGLSLGQLAAYLKVRVPEHALQRKGWAGLLIEKALGGEAGSRCLPDFTTLGIELKTLPINAAGYPSESTFVTSIPLLTIHLQSWDTSQCWSKLKRVLWVPVEADQSIPYVHRRIGAGRLWSASPEEARILASDWSELVNMIALGRLHEVHAGIGDYLQIRPKAADAKSLCSGFDEHGQVIQTLPRGFYLRRSFTATLLKNVELSY